MHYAIAQQMLQRRQHALQHLAIQFAGSAFHRQFRLLAAISSRLAHDARQPLHVAAKGHHARVHQAVLQISDDAPLLLQLVLGLGHQRTQQLLQAGDVAG
jgi:hypothetical protein